MSQAQDSSLPEGMIDARQHLTMFGPEGLSDAAILGLSLGKTTQEGDALLKTVGGLLKLESRTAKELSDLPGLGKSTAMRFVAMLELYRRCHETGLSWSIPLRRPADAADFVRAKLRGKEQERFVVVGLDSRQRLLLFRTIAIGSIADVNVHPREVFRPLIREGVHSVILAHNHPSGDCEPSEADVELTHRMYEVGRLVGIPVLDQLVVTDHEHCSLAALGLVPTS